MEKFKIQTVYYYDLVEGEELDTDIEVPLFWYKNRDGKWILNIEDTGAKLGKAFDNLEEVNSFIEQNHQEFEDIKTKEGSVYYKLSNRLNKLMSKNEFFQIKDKVDSIIGYDIFTFYNEALLLSTSDTYFDLVKFDNYLRKEYIDEYENGMSPKEFIEFKFGTEVKEFIEYLVECNSSM